MERSYSQWCGLALALDHVGDRWTLLIIRELLIESKRYTDLRKSLPGIATNLLADRLTRLEKDGLIRRHEVEAPTPAVLYELTETGQELEEPILALIRWGGRFMTTAPRTYDFRTDWLVLALRAILGSGAPDDTSVTCNVQVDGGWLNLVARDGLLHTGAGPAGDPDVILAGDPKSILGVAAGAIPLEEARRERDLSIEGSAEAVRELISLLGGGRTATRNEGNQ